MRNIVLILSLHVFLNFVASAKEYVNVDAPQGGTLQLNLSAVPTTINPLSSTDLYATQVQAFTIDSLLERDADTYEWTPSLATAWEVSKDGLSFTFTLRDGVQWHDGKPLTAEDVKFSFDAIKDPKKYQTGHRLSYFENIVESKIIEKNKIVFTAKQKYFGNLASIATMSIIPKHLYENPTKDQSAKLNRTLVGTGPYILDSFDRKKSLILKKNKNWWGHSLVEKKGEHNFETILMRFIQEDAIAFENFKKGKIDYLGARPEQYVKLAEGKEWGKTLMKKKVQNSSVKGYGYVAWNNKHPLFMDKEVRKALLMLMNRREMIKKFDFDLALPATGPLYQQSPYANSEVNAIEFDPNQARKILEKAGWKDSDGDLVLDKTVDGKKVDFKFTLLEPTQDMVKYMTVYQQDLKKAGIDMNIKIIEWNAFIKLLDERNFEAVRLAWGGGDLDWDPKQIWHSDSIANRGSNFIQYSNPKVDKLIDESRLIMDDKERQKVLKEVYKLIAEDSPYAFMFNSIYSLYFHQHYLKGKRDTLKYSIGTSYWWMEK
jgi:peptide/nickel transport system substrate-binding protein/microcin C transport system substrate-binding protein